MSRDRIWIVSNYNQDPTDVLSTLDGTQVVYNQGDTSYLQSLTLSSGHIRQTPHTGHNLSDYLLYIIENYSSLPAELGFAKGNLFPRHTTRTNFLKRLPLNGVVPFYSSTYHATFHRLFRWVFTSQQVAPGLLLEINNNWYCKKRPAGAHYPTFSQLYCHIFDREAPRYIVFAPAACMNVPSERITRWPREIYEILHSITTYQFFPVEAFHVERILFLMFAFPSE